jgi:hypothetical protein
LPPRENEKAEVEMYVKAEIHSRQQDTKRRATIASPG